MTDPLSLFLFFRLFLVILAVYPLIGILDSVCSVSVKTTLKFWLKLYWTFVIILGTSSMKIVCLCLFIQIYFISFNNILPFFQYKSWASFVVFIPRDHTGFVAILNRKPFFIAFFYWLSLYIRTFWVPLIYGDLVLLAYRLF